MVLTCGLLSPRRGHCTSLLDFLQTNYPSNTHPDLSGLSACRALGATGHIFANQYVLCCDRVAFARFTCAQASEASLNYRPVRKKCNQMAGFPLFGLGGAGYNQPVTGGRVSRRRFLVMSAGLAAAGFAPPTPTTPNPDTAERREYFVPLDDYHELPPACYEPNLIRPLEIILHWDGNRKGRDLWLAPITYETLKYLQQSSHFAVDYRRAWQMLPMHRTVVQESHGAKGYNWEAINVEMAGTDFDRPENSPPESEIRLTIRLVSQLMDFYRITFGHVVGHFERDPRGDKKDPGVEFMADFRERLKTYRASLSPIKGISLADI